MADLRAVMTSLGYTEVATYIQSGNVVFTSTDTDTALMAASIEAGIARALEVRPRVVVVSRDELAQVVRDNPYSAEANPKTVHAVFQAEDPGPDQVDSVAAAHRQAAAQGRRRTARDRRPSLLPHTPA